MIPLRHCRTTDPVPPDRGADTICVHDFRAIQLRCKCEPRTGMKDSLTHDRGLIPDRMCKASSTSRVRIFPAIA